MFEQYDQTCGQDLMIFGRKRNWEDRYDEEYVTRSDRREKAGRSTLWIHLITLAVTGLLLLAAVGLVGGQTMFEKTLSASASPIGIVWLLLLTMIYFGFLARQAWSGSFALICWLLLTLFGNSFIANQLVLSLERPWLDVNLADLEKLDVAFVLGGGTNTPLNGNPQAGSAGDRLVTAARLYYHGKIGMIVCTGTQWSRSSETDLHPHQEAARILADLSVPETAIAMIGGNNTGEEIELAATFLEQQNFGNARVGIISSAWHLDRAARLAGKNGLDVVMIPADFRSGFLLPGPDLLIPSAANLDTSAVCLKEYLARWIAR